MRSIEPSRLLRVAFGIDAIGTAAVAAVQLAGLDRLPALLNLPQPLLLESGVFMAAYAALLLGLMRSSRLWSALVLFITAGNGLWAVGCVATIGLAAPSALGIGWLLFQAVAVLLFATLQATALRTSSALGRPGSVGA